MSNANPLMNFIPDTWHKVLVGLGFTVPVARLLTPIQGLPIVAVQMISLGAMLHGLGIWKAHKTYPLVRDYGDLVDATIPPPATCRLGRNAAQVHRLAVHPRRRQLAGRPSAFCSALGVDPIAIGDLPARVLANYASILRDAAAKPLDTAPAWTPLFAQAAGLVTDVGGALAHGSIVAREFGIPAVMGTGVATERIRSGTLLTVDGNAGTVTLLDQDGD